MTVTLLALAGVAFSLRRNGLAAWAQVAVLGLLMVALGFESARVWVSDPAYGTDEAAFGQYAAQLVLHGSDPYTSSMTPAFGLFAVPDMVHTYMLDGGVVSQFSYPAGAFLPYVALLALGVTAQAPNIADVIYWGASIALLWGLLPREIRWLSVVLGAAAIYISYAAGGVTDFLYIPWTLGAVYAWDRFADPGYRNWKRWLGPLCLGVAIATKQTPWFLVPYLLLGLWFEARIAGGRPLRTLASYVAVAAGVFAAINIPWIVASPLAWLQGALTPFLQPTIPDGQGLVDVTLYDGIGGGNLAWFTVLGTLVFLTGLLAFTLCYDRLKRAWVPLIALGFFAATRSFNSYLFMLAPAALVAAVTVAPPGAVPFPRASRRAVVILGVCASLIVATGTAALATPSPLQISIVGTSPTGSHQTYSKLTVRLVNRTGSTVTPHFAVNFDGHTSAPWYALVDGQERSIRLAPYQSRTVSIAAPDAASEAPSSSAFFVEAFTAKPATFSSSAAMPPADTEYSTSVTPLSIASPVPVGHPVKLTVQLRDSFGQPVHRAGVRIWISQITYTSQNAIPGSASINGARPGATPTARTNANGQAVFSITGTRTGDYPVTIQTWSTQHGITFGYSNPVTIRFAPGRALAKRRMRPDARAGG